MSATTKAMTLNVKLAHIVAMLDILPPTISGFIREEVFDILDNHRRKVIKGAREWPNASGARKLIAGTTRRRPKTLNEDAKDQVIGEAYLRSPQTFEPGDRYWKGLEDGGVVNGSGLMAIPAGAGARNTGNGIRATSGFIRGLLRREFDIADGMLFKGPDRSGGPRLLMGVLRRSRRQRPLLGWYSAWAAVEAKGRASLDTVLDLAATEAGRSELVMRLEKIAASDATAKQQIAALQELKGNKRANKVNALRTAQARARQRIIRGDVV